MSRRRPLLLRIARCLAATALLVVASCTSSTADSLTGSSISESSAAVSPSVADVSTGPSSNGASESPASSATGANPTETADSPDPAAQETADRSAIEAQWRQFWIVYDQIVRTPKENRGDKLSSVAEPTLVANILKAADDADSQGIDNYGTWIHRISWQFPIAGAQTAVIADCQDQSKTGTYEVASGTILTVGKARSNMRGEFVKGVDNIWRLQQLYLLGDQEC